MCVDSANILCCRSADAERFVCGESRFNEQARRTGSVREVNVAASNHSVHSVWIERRVRAGMTENAVLPVFRRCERFVRAP